MLDNLILGLIFQCIDLISRKALASVVSRIGASVFRLILQTPNSNCVEALVVERIEPQFVSGDVEQVRFVARVCGEPFTKGVDSVTWTNWR